MASDISKHLGNLICLWLAGTDMPSAPAAVYVGLFNGDPKSTGTEVTTTINASGRVAVPWDSIAADDADVLIVNDTDIDFGDAAGDATVTHAALFDAASSGNMLASKAITGGSTAIVSGSPVKFLSGDLTFTVGS